MNQFEKVRPYLMTHISFAYLHFCLSSHEARIKPSLFSFFDLLFGEITPQYGIAIAVSFHTSENFFSALVTTSVTVILFLIIILL